MRIASALLLLASLVIITLFPFAVAQIKPKDVLDPKLLNQITKPAVVSTTTTVEQLEFQIQESNKQREYMMEQLRLILVQVSRTSVLQEQVAINTQAVRDLENRVKRVEDTEAPDPTSIAVLQEQMRYVIQIIKARDALMWGIACGISSLILAAVVGLVKRIASGGYTIQLRKHKNVQ